MHRSTPCRYFRTPPPLRAPPAATAVPPDGTSNSGTGNNGSRRDDDESKTDKSEKDGGIKKTSGQDGDENLFGELPITSSGAGENPGGAGRKKRGGDSLRSRALRNRSPKELPPVLLPSRFRDGAIYRFDRVDALNASLTEVFKGLLADAEWREAVSALFHGHPIATKDDLHSRMHEDHWRNWGSSSLLPVAYWHAACITYELQGAEAATKFLESHPAPWPASADLIRSVPERWIKSAPADAVHAYRDASEAVADETFQEAALVGLHSLFLKEITVAIGTDLAIEAPKNVKLSDLQRPVTVINTSYYTGYSVPRAIIRHVATSLKADVIHLRAHDIADIVGSYLGQDVVRAPSAISHMGYKTAANSGRSLAINVIDKDDDGTAGSYTTVIHASKLRKEVKKSVMTMDEFLNGTTRKNTDELWLDLKINSVLEELVHAADSTGPEQRPLLIHVDDYNAINMDLEAGSATIGKLRKVIDSLWADGRKIALVGTCSSKGAPKAYLDSLREISATDRLININTDPTRAVSTGQDTLVQEFEHGDCLAENQRNITAVLAAMLGSHLADTKAPRRGISNGLRSYQWATTAAKDSIPESWWTHVLPITEIYRIATMMIGLRGQDAFSQDAFREAAEMIKKTDEMRELFTRSEQDTTGDSNEEKRDLFSAVIRSGLRKKDADGEHEEQLLSGLVKPEAIRTTFANIHAPKETIESIRMLTTLSLIRPEAFSYGVLATERIPGCLLYGPPGTGKTLLAKAVARESGANMIEISAATINNMYVGESEKMVRALFRLARKREPLVIFIDEADALLGARSSNSRERTGSREVINQFLREWDGMDRTKAFIMVATNRPFDLDEAVLRRLPRKLLIDLPREQDRAEILRIHLRDEELDPSVDLADVARRTPLYSGSDLKNVCVAAAMAAVKEEFSALPSISTPNTTTTDSQREEQQPKPEEAEAKAEGAAPTTKRRVLHGRHFDAALREIGASVSEDMQTLAAIRRFDERYGDATTGAGTRARRRRGMGFEVVAEPRDSEGARVRGSP